jgi:hypothetical protein
MGASTEVVSNPRLSRPASGESLTRRRARPRVGHRLTGCTTVAVKRGSTALPYLTFYLQNSTFWRADERTRTADLISLRVIGQVLQGIANCPYLSRFLFPGLLRVAPYCGPGGIRSTCSPQFANSKKDISRLPLPPPPGRRRRPPQGSSPGPCATLSPILPLPCPSAQR